MEDATKALNYNLPHFRVEAFQSGHLYQRPNKDLSGMTSSRGVSHGKKLRDKLALAFQAAAGNNGFYDSDISESRPAIYLEILISAESSIPDLNWKSQDIRFSALRVADDGEIFGALYVPEDAVEFLTLKVQEYAEETVESGKAKNELKFAPVEDITIGDIESLWTDSRSFPRDMTKNLWWECWCISSRSEKLRRIARKLKLRINEAGLSFPDTEVLLVYANPLEMSILISNTDAVEELRKATDNPYFFTRLTPSEKYSWVADLVGRVVPPSIDCPAVCVLDNGVNQGHPLLQYALALEDCQSIHSDWGSDDHDGHGTNMAGTALYGDLTFALADQRSIRLNVRLESVKFIPPPNWSRNEPSSYGVITQAAVALAETQAPRRKRVFCMAISNEDVSGERPTTWSSAIDQICSGSMLGELDGDQSGPKRLFILSAGNIPDSSDPDDVSDLDEFPIEDPGQSWNAIAVGGFTDKVDLSDQPKMDGWGALAEVGGQSPYSRISTDWEHSRSPIKPEIVFEAGNKAISPDGRELLSGVPALSILTTGKNLTKNPIEEFWATSSATAQAAGLAAEIMARFPELWPETIRALIIHSAQWTPAMLTKLHGKTKKECIRLARQFGYGVPQLERALASAQNDLALISETYIQPFKKELNDKGREVGSPSFNEVHYYDLPWPKGELERLENREVQLKITLSYFIEPSPGEMAQVIPARYQSYGLRFELKRKSDTDSDFKHRINKLEKAEIKPQPAEVDNNWTFGSKSIAAGSVHSDVWIGHAIDLAARDKIAVYPVSGWWRYRAHLNRHRSKARYSLIISISSKGEDVQLYTEIANKIATHVEAEVSIEASI
ncbi:MULTISPECIES: S8 family peptidase [unclassified Pseudomonas]|uniref:S8 family peptidase n=1 Tax=unclassified Pseudomonas TaxID=196821 RepID=UPI0015A11265|nr:MULTISPECIES: S8 family peptidase [unclassified Pseudomonas]NVZ16690.1 S8 family peptidase [Pseudomonas sp. IPO3775]NWA78092.1 S8 family peptidase [Pseudomonas sp. C8002]